MLSKEIEEENYTNFSLLLCSYKTRIKLDCFSENVANYDVSFDLSSYGFLKRLPDGNYYDIIGKIKIKREEITKMEWYDFGSNHIYVTFMEVLDEFKKIEEERGFLATISNVSKSANVSLLIPKSFKPSIGISRAIRIEGLIIDQGSSPFRRRG